ncbi:hypothetical protein ACIBG8_48710 [Nonomuraea sp. NPDC050556]|uniref:hypothetical protein n=1 Tax=Nonomuraea sp. NPDC050556 TaxID=3364369 RepID=UPI0037A412E5
MFVAAFVVGGVLRLITMLGYGPAMWFNDSYEYVSVALHPRPDPIRPDGYSFWLMALKPFHSFAVVVLTQHLMGLATAVLIYALLRKRFGLPAWGATLAAAPVLFDAYQIQLEQLIMSDTMFMLLVVGVVTIVLWHRKLTWKLGALVGFLLALTWLTRSIGLPILALVVLYLLVKRTNWRAIVALVTACAIPVLSYMGWFSTNYGQFSMTNSDGLILYMRTATFADCAKMKINPRKEYELALLCINTPPAERVHYAQWYLWRDVGGTALHWMPGSKRFEPIKNEVAGEFAKRAILAQPGDYLKAVGTDLLTSFQVGRRQFPDPQTFEMYEFKPYQVLDQNGRPKRLPSWSSYDGRTDTDAFTYEQGPPETVIKQPWASIMSVYQQIFYMRGIMLGALLLIGLYGIAVRWRKLGGPVILPWLGSFGLILAPAATAEFDYRYLLPAIPLACIAAAITLRHGLPWRVKVTPTNEAASETTTART